MQPPPALTRSAKQLVLLLCLTAVAACAGDTATTSEPVPSPGGTTADSTATTQQAVTTAPSNTEAVTTTTPGPPIDSSTTSTLAGESSVVGDITRIEVDTATGKRSARLYVPSGLDGDTAPLFIALHGGFGWGDQFAYTTGIERLAETNKLIAVHPDGTQIPGLRGGTWNGGTCCGNAEADNVDDVAFIEALIDRVTSEHNIDTDRIFAIGHSNGGIMSYRLACQLSERITGIGVVAGTLAFEPCTPAQPTSVIHVHGTGDEHLPIGGGVGAKSVSREMFPSPTAGFDVLAAHNGCPTPAVTVTGDITQQLSTPCDSGTASAFVTIDGAQHPWPQAAPGSSLAVGDAYPNYNATSEIVTFLLNHPRRS